MSSIQEEFCIVWLWFFASSIFAPRLIRELWREFICGCDLMLIGRPKPTVDNFRWQIASALTPSKIAYSSRRSYITYIMFLNEFENHIIFIFSFQRNRVHTIFPANIPRFQPIHLGILQLFLMTTEEVIASFMSKLFGFLKNQQEKIQIQKPLKIEPRGRPSSDFPSKI